MAWGKVVPSFTAKNVIKKLNKNSFISRLKINLHRKENKIEKAKDMKIRKNGNISVKFFGAKT